MTYAKIFLFSIFLFFQVGFFAVAQTTTKVFLPAAAATVVSAKDLDASEPKLLPGNALYWLKEAFRGLNIALRYKPDAKARQLLDDANARLLEVQKLAAQKGAMKEKTLESSLEKYDRDIARAKELIAASDNNDLKNKYISQEFTRQRIFDALERLETSDSIAEFQKKSMEAYAKLLFKGGMEAGKQQLKDYVDKNIKFDAKSLQDMKIMEKAQTALSDEGNQRAFGDAREYAMQKITDDLKSFDAEAQSKKIREFLKVEKEDEVRLDPKSIIEKIIQEKARLDEEYKKLTE